MIQGSDARPGSEAEEVAMTRIVKGESDWIYLA